MTDLNSKVKIHVVDELFVGDDFATDVWASEDVQQALGRLPPDVRVRFLDKLRYYATGGFGVFTGGRGRPIRVEWEGVFRVAHSPSLFRVIGFFDERHNAVFIAMDAFKKQGKKLTSKERRRIDAVARVNAQGNWRKRDE